MTNTGYSGNVLIGYIKTNIMSKKEIAAERLLDGSLGILQVPEVANRLGDHTDSLKGALDRVAPTDINPDGFLELQSGRGTIPLIIRSIGEGAVLHASDSAMNPYQLESLAARIGQEKAMAADRKFRNHLASAALHKSLPLFEDKEGMAVSGSNWWLPKPGTIIEGRPYVSMNTEAGIGSNLSPVVFLHELIHVLQKEANPVHNSNTLARNKVRHELEAYYVAAQIILGMKDAGRHTELLDHTPRHELDRARAIESVRRDHQDHADPFDPNDRVVKALVDNELNITKELGNIIRANAQ